MNNSEIFDLICERVSDALRIDEPVLTTRQPYGTSLARGMAFAVARELGASCDTIAKIVRMALTKVSGAIAQFKKQAKICSTTRERFARIVSLLANHRMNEQPMRERAMPVASIAVTVSEFGVSRDDMNSIVVGQSSAAFARQVVMYVACCGLGMSKKDGAAIFGLGINSATHGLAKIEDMRDDPEFDAIMDRLEREALDMVSCE